MAESTAVTDHAAAFDVDRRVEAAGILQDMIVELINLSLIGKQAHWNVRGPMFKELHLQLDELVEIAREGTDTLAERCLALGVPADGRLEFVTQETHQDSFPEGRLEDTQVVDLMVNTLKVVSEVGRSKLGLLGDLDPVSQDLLNNVLEDVEKHLWLFDAHTPI
jgi:starvation-inducible DNA-binding protein